MTFNSVQFNSISIKFYANAQQQQQKILTKPQRIAIKLVGTWLIFARICGLNRISRKPKNPNFRFWKFNFFSSISWLGQHLAEHSPKKIFWLLKIFYAYQLIPFKSKCRFDYLLSLHPYSFSHFYSVCLFHFVVSVISIDVLS